MKLVNQPTVHDARQVLDFLSARQKVIAANLANLDTPGYRVKDLTFQRELFAASGGNELPGGALLRSRPAGFQAEEVGGLPEKNDGNNVSLDREMVLLSETSIKYNMMVQMLVKKFQIIRIAARDGR